MLQCRRAITVDSVLLGKSSVLNVILVTHYLFAPCNVMLVYCAEIKKGKKIKWVSNSAV